jgi:hypothetical protein
MKELIKDYKDHGYKLKSNKDGVLVFETDFNYNKINNKRDKDHPIFLDDKHGTGSRVTMKSYCNRCKNIIIDGKCSICNRTFKMPTAKGHIDHLFEVEARANKLR